MLRGEFRRADGLIIPNNVTEFGAQTILDLALRNGDLALWVGLCSGVYDTDLQVSDLVEPTIGTHGYARIGVPRTNLGWPTLSATNGEQYAESLPLVWTATGDFDQPITRMFICGDETLKNLPVFALSGALAAPLTIGAATPLQQRTFTYRLYLR